MLRSQPRKKATADAASAVSGPSPVEVEDTPTNEMTGEKKKGKEREKKRCIFVGGGIALSIALLLLCLFLVPSSGRLRGKDNAITQANAATAFSKVNVVIIGAGAAGLAAAYTLDRHGVDYIILESSNGIGGRVQKDLSFTNGQYPLDLGASFIQHPKDIRRIVNRDGIEMKVPPGEGMYGQPNFVNYSYYDFLSDYIAPKDKSKIQHGCRVTSIDYTENDIVVTCQNGVTFLSQHAIVTVPLSILQGDYIDFNPPLPSRLTKGHPGEMWNGFKLVFEFEQEFSSSFCFPDMDGAQGQCHGSSGENFFWVVSAINERLENGHTILMGYIMGDPAGPFLALNDEKAMVQRVLDLIDDRFNGQASKHYVDHMVLSWSKNPDIRGTYASRPYDEEGAQNVQDKIWIAGEAFPAGGSVNGWVDAAAFSGDDAAKQILKLTLGIDDDRGFWRKVWKDLED